MGRKKEEINMKQVHEWLSDCLPDKAFYLTSGVYIRNLHELYDALLHMRDELFTDHVNKKKNDFYNWIQGVVGDRVLAEQIKPVKDRLRMVLAIRRRLDELEAVEHTFEDQAAEEEGIPVPKREDREKKRMTLAWELFFIGLILGLIVGYVLAFYVRPLIA
ncbi:MAG: hypothetical protein GXP63_04850 [DPANN group archaeon]|nr:hypothetical protein [DPANN group archaeon]